MKRAWKSIKVTTCIAGCILLLAGQGLSADTVLFGINVPLSGSYAKQGEDELKAYKLAVKTINEQGGILGKKVIYAVKDTKTNADVARANAQAFINDGAIMFTGGSSSACAIAQSEEAQKALGVATRHRDDAQFIQGVGPEGLLEVLERVRDRVDDRGS